MIWSRISFLDNAISKPSSGEGLLVWSYSLNWVPSPAGSFFSVIFNINPVLWIRIDGPPTFEFWAISKLHARDHTSFNDCLSRLKDRHVW